MEKDKKFEIIALTSLLLCLLILFLILNSFSPLLMWDETGYLANARSHIANSNYTDDFRHPLLEWLIALVWLPGESLLTAKIFIILITLAAVFFTYLISREYFSVKRSSLVTLGFGLSPLIVFWGFRIYTDIPAMFFTVVSFYCFLKKEKLRENGEKAFFFLALAGIMAALAFLTRFPVGLFALSSGIYCIFKKRYKDLTIFAAFFVLALTPWLVYNQIHYQDLVWDFKAQYSAQYSGREWTPAIQEVMALFLSIGILVFLLPLGFYSLFRQRNEKKLIWLILIYVVASLVYYSFFLNMKSMRYCISFLPFLYLIAFDGLFFWLDSKINKKIIRKIIYLFIVFNIVVIFGATLFSVVNQSYYQRNCSLYQSILYLKGKNAHSASISILSHAGAGGIGTFFGYHLNAKVTENLESIEIQNPDYVVYIYDSEIARRWMGTSFNKKILDDDDRLKIEKEISDKYNNKVSIYSLKRRSFK